MKLNVHGLRRDVFRIIMDGYILRRNEWIR